MRFSSLLPALYSVSAFACSSTGVDASGPGAGTGAGGVPSGSGGTTAGVGGAVTGGTGTGAASGGVGTGGTLGSGGSNPDPTALDCGFPELSAPLGASTQPLEVVNWAGRQAALSYTLDDGTASQIANYDALNGLGVPLTFYLVTNWGANNAVWKRAVADGHEIGNHSQSHPEMGTGPNLDAATAFLEEELGVRPLTMAAPYGNPSYPPLAPARFLINRGVGGGSIAPNGNSDQYNLPTYTPPSNANKATLDSGVSNAVSQGRWQTVLVHGFTGGGDGAYQPIPLADFLAHIEGQRDGGQVWIDTVLRVGAYYLGQKLLTAATPVPEGSATKWSWTLPEFFPTGHCLRVRSSGRVLQGGQPVAENPLGYYDIALDAGELTVEPR